MAAGAIIGDVGAGLLLYSTVVTVGLTVEERLNLFERLVTHLFLHPEIGLPFQVFYLLIATIPFCYGIGRIHLRCVDVTEQRAWDVVA